MDLNHREVSMKMILIVLVLFVTLLLASPATPTAMPGADDADALKKLQDRVDVLEKTVVADPLHPSQTVLARLESAEKAIKELQKQDTTTAKAEGKDDESMRKSLSELQKDSEDVDRRLKSAEDQLRRTAAADTNEVRELKRSVDQLDRTIDTLQDRVRRLEAKK
jgi:hypothetical protein